MSQTTAHPTSASEPLTKNHANFQTRKLVFRRDSILVRYSGSVYVSLVLLSLIISPFLIIPALTFRLGALPFLAFGGLIELILSISIISCLVKRNHPMFDTLNGVFYPQGRKHTESAVPTKNIDHLQVIAVNMDVGFCYELNAVMKDGSRLPIIAHGGETRFVSDAKQLAECLALPLKDEHGKPFVAIPGKGTGPLVRGGSNFQNMHLVFRQDAIAVKPTWKIYLFVMIFQAFALLLICIGLFSEQEIIWAPFSIGIVFTLIILCILISNLKRCAAPFFDMGDGVFYPKGFTRDGSGIALSQLDHLEIIKERCHTSKSSYDSYELNVVLKNGSRYNILDHSNGKLLWEDAHKLAKRLSLPLMDVTNGNSVEMQPEEIPENISNPMANKAPMTTAAAVFQTIFGLIFFGAGFIAAWMGCLGPLTGVFASRNWTPTPARIVKSQVVTHPASRGGSTRRIDIRYEYDVNGRHYTGERYDFFRSKTSTNVGVSTMHKIVASLPPGTETTCLVNPSAPHKAVISREVPWSHLLFILFPLPFYLIGGYLIVSAIKAKCLKPKA